ncbi:MAG: LysR family transcriptional regulator [Clostridiales Family XIII bacterium]|jgi:DNA-binding transcriptional LysR family regulator|nr:LysR family transcriptional regulator [Clostridiales Family XIII bacterium]
MTIHQMECFCVVAQTLSYTKASQALYMTQQGLSRIIASMEAEMGVKLFVRDKRLIRLTHAGATFLAETAPLLQAYRNAVEKTKKTYENMHNTLCVGIPEIDMVQMIPAAAYRFREACPETVLNLSDYTFSTLQEALLKDKVDVAILPEWEVADMPGIEHEPLATEGLCVVTHVRRSIAGRDFAKLDDFRGRDFIVPDSRATGGYLDFLVSLFSEQDFRPQNVHYTNTFNHLLVMVESELGVSVLPGSMSRFASPNIKFVKIPGYEASFKTVCAWKEDKKCRVQPFVQVMKGCCGIFSPER